MAKFNQLPKNFPSWLALVNYVRVNLPDIYSGKVRVTSDVNSDYNPFKQKPLPEDNEKVEVYEIEMDYAKARAFEELGNIPSEDDAMSAIYASKGSFMTNNKNTEDFLFNIAKLQSVYSVKP